MTTPTAAMTKIDAVNLMLASIGQSPINTLAGTIPKEVTKSVLALDNALREVCTQGWAFNSRYAVELSPSSDKIDIPSNYAHVDPTYGENYVMQWDTAATAGLRLFNLNTNLFSGFGTAAVKCDVIIFVEYEQLPQHVRQYVVTKAARKFQSGVMASTILYEFTREMETEAYATFRRMEKRQKDFNINKNRTGAHRRFNAPR